MGQFRHTLLGLILAAGVLTANSVPAQTPTQRKAILDAVRDEVQEVYGKSVMFQVHRLTVNGGDAVAEVTAIRPKATDDEREIPVAGIPRLRATLGLARKGVWQVTELAALSKNPASGGEGAKKSGASGRSAPSTPSTAERKAMLDALRLELEAEYKRPILFQVQDIKVFRAQREGTVKVRCLKPTGDGSEGIPYKDIAPITAILSLDTDGNWGVSDWGGPGDFEQK